MMPEQQVKQFALQQAVEWHKHTPPSLNYPADKVVDTAKVFMTFLNTELDGGQPALADPAIKIITPEISQAPGTTRKRK